ncbi:MAG TPA: hypothetical protein VF263_11510 [Longimicrobiaceae bacterium]
MRKTRKIGTGVFAAAVAAALAFGGGTAAASTRAEAACSNPAAACVVTVQCIEYCFPYGGRCSKLVGTDGCCVCNR